MDTKIKMEGNKAHRTAPEADVDVSLLKILSLAFFTTLLALAFGYFFNFYLENGEIYALIASLVFAILFASLFLIQTFAIKDGWRAFLATLMQGAALSAWFYAPERMAVFLVPAVFAAIVLLYGGMRGRAGISNMLRIRFSGIGGIVVHKVILSLAVIVGMSIYLFHIDKDKIVIPKELFTETFSIARGFIPALSDTTEKTTLEEYFLSSVRAQAQKQIPDFTLLPEPMQDKVLNEGMQAAGVQLKSILGDDIDMRISISEAVHKTVSSRFADISPETRSAIFAVLVFLTIIGLSLPIGYLVIFISFIIFEILLMTGFMSRTLEERSREIIILR